MSRTKSSAPTRVNAITLAEEVNAAIELHLMGCVEVWNEEGQWLARRTSEGQPVPVRSFTSDQAAAQLVLDKLSSQGYSFAVSRVGQLWRVVAQRGYVTRRGQTRQEVVSTVEDASRELAISLAVLSAIGHPLGRE